MVWAFIGLLQITVINKPIRMPYVVKRDTSKNFIVLHYDDSDSYSGTRRWLIKKGNSYHYYIQRSGTIIKMVDPTYQANHAGASLWRSYLRMNKYSIGICLQNNAKQEYTEKQYASLTWLIKTLQKRYPDSTSRIILGHSDIAVPRGRKHDPGPQFVWDKLFKSLEDA